MNIRDPENVVRLIKEALDINVFNLNYVDGGCILNIRYTPKPSHNKPPTNICVSRAKGADEVFVDCVSSVPLDFHRFEILNEDFKAEIVRYFNICEFDHNLEKL